MVASSCPAQLRVGGPGARCLVCPRCAIQLAPSFGGLPGFVPVDFASLWYLFSCCWFVFLVSLSCLIPKMKLPCLLCFPAVALRLRITAGKVKCSCMPNLVLCPVGLAKCIVSFWIWDPLVTCIRPQERFPPKSPLGWFCLTFRGGPMQMSMCWNACRALFSWPSTMCQSCLHAWYLACWICHKACHNVLHRSVLRSICWVESKTPVVSRPWHARVIVNPLHVDCDPTVMQYFSKTWKCEKVGTAPSPMTNACIMCPVACLLWLAFSPRAPAKGSS